MKLFTPLIVVAVTTAIGATTPTAPTGAVVYSTTAGSLLYFNGTSWVALSGASGTQWREGGGAPSNAVGSNGDFYLDVTPASGNALLLANDADVAISSPTTGQTLIYNGTQWANVTAASSGGVYNAAGAAAKSIAGSTFATPQGTTVTLPTSFTSVSSYVVLPISTVPVAAANTSSSAFLLSAATLGLTISAGISTPYAIALDSAGNIYVANQGSNTVTKYVGYSAVWNAIGT